VDGGADVDAAGAERDHLLAAADVAHVGPAAGLALDADPVGVGGCFGREADAVGRALGDQGHGAQDCGLLGCGVGGGVEEVGNYSARPHAARELSG